MLSLNSNLLIGFIDFLEEGGCCFVIILAIVGLTILLAGRIGRNAKIKCDKCQALNRHDALFCQRCGIAFNKKQTPASFYPNLFVRIANWQKWEWVDNSEAIRISNLTRADQEVFGGKAPQVLKNALQKSSDSEIQQADEEVLDFSQLAKDPPASVSTETIPEAILAEEPHGLAALEPQQVEQEVEPEEPTAEAEESVEVEPGIKPTQVEAEGGQSAVQSDGQVTEDTAEPTDDSSATDAEPVVPAPPKAIPVFKPHRPATAPVQPAVARVVPDTEPAISQAPKAVGPATPAVEVPPSKPPRRLSDILRGFMDESNIKLGEFVAGLLIIIGSIGLVTALNIAYKNIPYLSSVVFLTIVSLFHIFGIYSLKKWNLASSSRVVLLIGNLLIPLNVLMTTMRDTSLAEQRIFFILAVVVAGVSFGAMSFYSARLLAPERPWPLILALMGPCLCQLVIKLAMTGEDFIPTPFSTNVLLLPAIAFISFAILSEHRYFRKSEDVTPDDAFSLLRVLGLGVFSLGACIALMFFRLHTQDQRIELSQYLSNPLMILCFIVVSAGMLIYRRIESDDH
ncbi:MAG: hypothetical protein MKZ94_10765 [Pirellulales bacterium]|nr:hypothetical protein [Pirellulales bacterium]